MAGMSCDSTGMGEEGNQLGRLEILGMEVKPPESREVLTAGEGGVPRRRKVAREEGGDSSDTCSPSHEHRGCSVWVLESGCLSANLYSPP